MIDLPSKHLQVSIESEGSKGNCTIIFAPSFELTVGLSQRVRQAFNLVRAILKKYENVQIERSDDRVEAQLNFTDVREVLEIIGRIDRKVEQFAGEPLTSKSVEDVLKITSQERTRWTKDGRLASAGKTTFRRGQNKIQLFIYAPAVVANLFRAPWTIEEWRRRDETNAIEDCSVSENNSCTYAA